MLTGLALLSCWHLASCQISERSIKRKSAPTHPNSRRAAQLARVSHRKSKLQTQKGVRNKLTSAKVDRLSTLILLLPDDKVCLPDLYSVHDFINTFYLSRHDDEIEELQSQRRPGQPASRRQIELTHVRDRERQLYQEGMEIPDLTCEINVRLLREWDGDPQALPMFKMVRVSGTYR